MCKAVPQVCCMIEQEMFHLQGDGETVDFSVWVRNKDSTISQMHAVNKVLEGERDWKVGTN